MTNAFTDDRARTLRLTRRVKGEGVSHKNTPERKAYNPPTTGPINGASRENTQEDRQ